MKEKKNTLVATDSTSTPGAKGKGGGRPTTAAELQPEEEYRLLNKGSSRGDWQIAKITERVYLRCVGARGARFVASQKI